MSNEVFKDDTKFTMGNRDSGLLDHFGRNGAIDLSVPLYDLCLSFHLVLHFQNYRYCSIDS